MNNSQKVGALIVMAILLSSLATYGQQRSLTTFKGPPLKVVGNVSWSGVVYLDRDVIVTANAVLTIMPGTVVLIEPQLDRSKQNMELPGWVYFPTEELLRNGIYAPFVEIAVLGTLNANGTEEMPIVFFAAKESLKGKKSSPVIQKDGKYQAGNLTVDPRAPMFQESSLWGGIHFPFKSKGTLKHCIIANAVAAVTCWSSQPTLKNCIFSNNKTGVHTDQSNPIVEDCFIFRCRSGGSFCEDSVPTLRNTVITECETGLTFAHTVTKAVPTITNCVIAKAKIGIHNHGEGAAIYDTLFHECALELRLFTLTALVVEGNTFTSERGTFLVSGYKQGDQESFQGRFPNNTFEPIIFKNPNYAYPPDGNWQKINGVSNANKSDNNENKAESSATFYGQSVTGTNILFLLDISGSMQGARLDKLRSELKDMINNLSTSSSCEVNFIWFSKMIVAKDIGIKLNRPNAAKNLTRSFDQRYAGGSTNFERAWDEGLRVARSSKIDVIYFLSDGKSKTPVPLIQDWYNKNRKNKLIINTVAIGLESELLEEIAKVGGGEYKCAQ